jgi:hypothetical protein
MPKHDEIVAKLLDKGLKPKQICKETGLSVTQVYRSAGRYRQASKSIQPIDSNSDITKYHDDMLDLYKRLSLSVGNSITNRDIKKSSLAQKTVIMATLTDKIRLIEGKSTENIAIDIVAGLDDKTLKELKDLSRSLIKSMLSKDS